jgi:hypothetical protein
VSDKNARNDWLEFIARAWLDENDGDAAGASTVPEPAASKEVGVPPADKETA